MDPLKYLFEKPTLSCRIARWHMILSEFDIVFATQKSEKGRVIAEYLVEHPLDDGHPMEPLFPDETVQFTEADIKSPEWKLFFDGVYN